jgi:hypothetical protein
MDWKGSYCSIIDLPSSGLKSSLTEQLIKQLKQPLNRSHIHQSLPKESDCLGI